MCVVDTTFGSSTSKKELFTLAFTGDNNVAFNGGRAYIPNAQKLLFAMMVGVYLPELWGRLSLRGLC